jgi:hypothetical protein
LRLGFVARRIVAAGQAARYGDQLEKRQPISRTLILSRFGYHPPDLHSGPLLRLLAFAVLITDHPVRSLGFIAGLLCIIGYVGCQGRVNLRQA